MRVALDQGFATVGVGMRLGMLTEAQGEAVIAVLARRVLAAASSARAARRRWLTLGADKGRDCADFGKALRRAGVTPHAAQKIRCSAIAGRTLRHPGYAVSQKRRKRIEEPFGGVRAVGPMAQTLRRVVKRVGARFTRRMAAGSLARQSGPAARDAGFG